MGEKGIKRGRAEREPLDQGIASKVPAQQGNYGWPTSNCILERILDVPHTKK
jgi:hypothetical protein